jgi:hypothetical protein
MTCAKVSLFWLLFGAVSMAQTAPHATIPFAFEVDGAHMPAGKYQVLPAGSATSVQLRAEGADAATVTVSQAAIDKYAIGCSCLRFHRYADGSLVLSDINLGHGAPALELASAVKKSREEFPVEAVQIKLAGDEPVLPKMSRR